MVLEREEKGIAVRIKPIQDNKELHNTEVVDKNTDFERALLLHDWVITNGRSRYQLMHEDELCSWMWRGPDSDAE
jgi:hypothetical protein